jgi:hypothetical protein
LVVLWLGRKLVLCVLGIDWYCVSAYIMRFCPPSAGRFCFQLVLERYSSRAGIYIRICTLQSQTQLKHESEYGNGGGRRRPVSH